MGLINTSLVLGKISQVLNELYEFRTEEAARVNELHRKIDVLEATVSALTRTRAEDLSMLADAMNKSKAPLARDLEYVKKNMATRSWLEVLGNKIGEVGKTVNEHFESFVNVSEKDTELFRLMAIGIAKVAGEKEEASAEPKLAEKKNGVNGSDGLDGQDVKKAKRKPGRPKKKAAKDVEKPLRVTEGTLGIHSKACYVYLSSEVMRVLKEHGLTHMSYYCDDDDECVLSFIKNNTEGRRVCQDGRIYDAALTRFLYGEFGNSAKAKIVEQDAFVQIIINKNKEG